MSFSTLQVRDLIAQTAQAYDRSTLVPVDEITRAVIARIYPEFDEVSIVSCYVWQGVRRQAKEFLTRYWNDEKGRARQMTFPGYEHLQLAYPLRSDKGTQVVPLEALSEDQLVQIADEMEKTGKTNLAHSLELTRYRRAKFGAFKSKRAVL